MNRQWQIMRPSFVIRWFVALLLLALAFYCAMGVLQAVSISEGGRAIWNINFWASGSLLAAVFASLVAPICANSGRRTSIAQHLAPWGCFAIAGAAAWSVVSHLLALDACLGRGGTYNYHVGSCSLVESNTFMPLYKSHAFPLVATVVFFILGLRSLLRLRAKLRRTSSAT